MLPSSSFPATILTLERGRSRLPIRTLTHGEPMIPVSIGSEGDWRVESNGVERVHLYLDFDGETVHVCPAAPNGAVSLNGARIESWAPVPVPSELHFGDACLTVRLDDEPVIRPTASERLPASGYGKTQVLDLHQLGFLRSLMEPPAEGAREIPVRRCVAVGPADPPPIATPRPESPAVPDTHRVTGAPLFGSTLCDGGALRDLAARAVASVDGVPPPQPSVNARSEPAPASAPAPAPLPGPRGRFLGVASAWSQSSRPKRAVALLLPILAIAALWPKEPRSTAAHATTSERGAKPGLHAKPPRRPAPQQPPPARALTTPTAAESPDAIAESSPLERRALARAFEGALTDAAESYTSLAKSGRRSRVFDVAARASRSGAVRKP